VHSKLCMDAQFSVHNSVGSRVLMIIQDG